MSTPQRAALLRDSNFAWLMGGSVSGDMKIARHSIDEKVGNEKATFAIVDVNFLGVLQETHFMPTHVVLNVETN